MYMTTDLPLEMVVSKDPSNRRPIPSEPFPLSNSGFLPIALRTRWLNVPSSTLESRRLCTLVHHSIALSSCSACFSRCSCSTEIIWSPPCTLPDSSDLIILTLVRSEHRLDVVGQGWLRRHSNTHHVFLPQDVWRSLHFAALIVTSVSTSPALNTNLLPHHHSMDLDRLEVIACHAFTVLEVNATATPLLHRIYLSEN